MAIGPKALVKPALLVWARDSAGVTIDDAAKNVTTLKKLAAWEADEGAPTMRQLRLLANKYKRPLSVFYLPEPPKDFQPLSDYRRLPGEIAGVLSRKLRYEIRIAQERRQLAIDLYDEIREEPPAFTLRSTSKRDPEQLGLDIRKFLGVKFQQQTAWKETRIAYNAWRDLIEAKGVLVFQATGVELREMRGFAVADDMVSIIAVNSRDSYSGRSFSLLHELCHLALHKSGISDFTQSNADEDRPPEERQIEIYCNQVAAATLMPKDLFLAERLVEGNKGTPNWSDEDLSSLARRFGVSQEAALRRLLTFSRTTQAFYTAKRQEFQERYERQAQIQKEQDGGPQWPIVVLSRIGPSLSRLILQTYYRQRITLNDVSGYLGLKVPHIPKLEAAAYGRSL